MNGKRRLGVVLLVTFLVTTSLRDINLGGAFARFGFFEVAFAAFGTATACFLGLILLFAPAQLRTLRLAWRDVLFVNATTAVAWLSYFGSLTFIEPSVTNTVYSGVAPLAVMAFAACGFKARTEDTIHRAERVAQFGLCAALGALGWVVLSGHAGLAGSSLLSGATGLALAALSGISITAETIIAKRMNESGVLPTAVLGVRFVLVALIAAGAVLFDGPTPQHDAQAAPGYLPIAALVLVAAPIYLVQAGLALTSPMITGVVLSLGPMFVFAAQMLSGNTPASIFVLVAIALYCTFAILGNLCLARRPVSDSGQGVAPSARAAEAG